MMKIWRHTLLIITLFLLTNSSLLDAAEFFDVRKEQSALYDTFRREETKLLARANATQKDYYRLSEELLKRARTLEPNRQKALDELFRRARLDRPHENGTKALSKNSRGLLGDVDLGNMSRTSFDKVIKIACKMGYEVDLRGGSATIKELDTTLFYRKSESQVFKKANIIDGEYMTAFEYGKGNNMTAAQQRVFNIFDCLKKYERTLVLPKESLSKPEVIQSMAKSSLRLCEARGAKLSTIEVLQGKIEDHLAKGNSGLPKLKMVDKLTLLKHGYSPRAAGLVKANATAAQEVEALLKFQQRCIKVAKSSYNHAVKSSGKIEQKYSEELRRARQAKDLEAINKYKSKLVQHRSAYRKSHTALLKNNGLRSVAKIEGVKAKSSSTLENPIERKALRNEIIKKSVARQNNAAHLQGKKEAGRLLSKARVNEPTSPKIKALGSGALTHIAIATGSNLISRLKAGQDIDQSLKAAAKDIMSAEFIFGDLLGSTVGAVAGSMIPLPAAITSAGFLGRAFGTVPAIGLAMLGGQLGYKAVTLLKDGQLSLANLFSSIDLPSLLTQTLGAALGVAAAAALIPGTVGAIIGGMVGSILVSKIFEKIKEAYATTSDHQSPKEDKRDVENIASMKMASTTEEQSAMAKNEAMEQLPQLTLAAQRAYERFIIASRSSSPQADELLREYRAKKEELAKAQREAKAL